MTADYEFLAWIEEDSHFARVEDRILGARELQYRLQILIKQALLAPGELAVTAIARNIYNRHFLPTMQIALGARRAGLRLDPRRRRYYRFWLTLLHLYRLVERGATLTIRGLFYTLKAYFGEQRQLNAVVDEIAGLLHVSVRALGIIVESHGRLGGSLQLRNRTTGRLIDLEATAGVRMGVIDSMEVAKISEHAHCILVIEKDAIFQRLMSERIFERLPMVLICGGGFPDLATRQFLHQLHQLATHLPILGLFDFNPSGFWIFLTYRLGSLRKGLENAAATAPIQLLGLSAADVADPAMFLPLQSREATMLENLLEHPMVQQQPAWQAHLRAMTAVGTAEIEAVQIAPAQPLVIGDHQIVHRVDPLVNLLCRKILRRQYLPHLYPTPS
jgi:DNA topoisomerase VI subunit A